jgi:phosphoglycerate dehydrogenase-like enzyme
MRGRCAVLDDYQGVALSMADWSTIADAVEVTVFGEPLVGEDGLVEAVGECAIVVVMRERTPFPASVFARLPQLRLLVTTGMRNASVDLAAASTHGVVVCGTASSSEPPAELTWALILGLARQIVAENTALRTGGSWQSTVGVDLAGARLGLLGLGRIGSRVARVGLAFGMQVAAFSQHLTQERAEEVGVTLTGSIHELFEGSDFVSIHLQLSDRTRGLVGRGELSRMPAGGYLVNTSRAAIVDQASLLDALRSGRLAGAGLDVFDVEPLPLADTLRTLPNILATPHLGYVTHRNYRTFYREAVEDITAFLAGTPVRQLS